MAGARHSITSLANGQPTVRPVAERTAAALLLSARHPVISVNGNTAALAAREIAALQKACGALVEVNLFHRTEERVHQIEDLLRSGSRCFLRHGRTAPPPLP